MHVLVVYDSQFGNTAQIAQAIAEVFRVSSQARAVQVGALDPAALQAADLLVVGSPTQGWRPTPAMQAFLASISATQLQGAKVVCFDTRFQQPRWLTGSAARAMSRTLIGKHASLLVPPQSFFVVGKEGPLVDGEAERAVAWAREIADAVVPIEAALGANT